MQSQPGAEVVADTDVQRPMLLAGKNVDEVTRKSRHSLTQFAQLLPAVVMGPGLRRGDEYGCWNKLRTL